MNFSNKTQKIDALGALASALCLVHCLATPFLFLGLFGLSNKAESVTPFWGSLDWIFLAITFFAVFRSAKTTTIPWVRYAFWISWGLLLGFVLNEKSGWIEVEELLILVPSLSLICVHLYNLRYCKCEG